MVAAVDFGPRERTRRRGDARSHSGTGRRPPARSPRYRARIGAGEHWQTALQSGSLKDRPGSHTMDAMYLADVEAFRGAGPRAEAIERLRVAGQPIPQIMHLFAYKPDRTDHLAAFTQGVMRGPSPLSPGQRELIAALTSKLNQCLF